MVYNSIILDTSRYVSHLRRLGGEVELMEGKHFVTDMLEDLFSCFTNAKTVHSKLSALVAEISSGKYEYGYTLLDDRIAKALWDIGIESFNQLRRLQAFMPDGLLPYYYFAIADRHFNDVLLLRLYDLPHPTIVSAFDAEYDRIRQRTR